MNENGQEKTRTKDLGLEERIEGVKAEGLYADSLSRVWGLARRRDCMLILFCEQGDGDGVCVARGALQGV